MQDIVDDYKNANLTISKNCKKISEMLLVKIDGKRVYDNLEFEEEQVMYWWTGQPGLFYSILTFDIRITFAIEVSAVQIRDIDIVWCIRRFS